MFPVIIKEGLLNALPAPHCPFHETSSSAAFTPSLQNIASHQDTPPLSSTPPRAPQTVRQPRATPPQPAPDLYYSGTTPASSPSTPAPEVAVSGPLPQLQQGTARHGRSPPFQIPRQWWGCRSGWGCV